MSFDNTISIIKDFKQEKIKLISEKDEGIYDALNKGIRLANGDIIGFLHSDDYFACDNIISDIVEKFNDTLCHGLYGNLQYVDKSNTLKVIRNWESSRFFLKLLKKGWMPPHPTLFLRSSICEEVGHFNTNYKISADYDFILRVFKRESLDFEYLPKVITKMRIGGESNRSLSNILHKIKEDYIIIKNNNIGGFITLILKNTSKIKQFFNTKDN